MDKYQIGIEEYLKGKSIKNICKEYHLTPKLLRNRLVLKGVQIRGRSTTQKPYNNDLIENILNDYKSKTPSIIFQISGTYDVLKYIKDYFYIKAEPRRIVSIYDLKCKGNIKALGIFDILYKDATIYLQRKYDIYYNFKFQYLPSKAKANRRP